MTEVRRRPFDRRGRRPAGAAGRAFLALDLLPALASGQLDEGESHAPACGHTTLWRSGETLLNGRVQQRSRLPRP